MQTEQTEKPNTLYDIALQGVTLIERIIANGGELDAETEAMLAVNEQELTTKVDGYYSLLERLESEAVYWKAQAAAREKVAKTCSNAHKNLKERLKQAMVMLGKKEVDGIDVTFKLSPIGERLEIDPLLLPSEYLMTVSEQVPDKERIKADLQALKTIPGAALAGGFMLRSTPRRRVK